MIPTRVIGIAGGSASGKSTLAAALESRLGARCLRICHDRYYKTASPTTNFDHPNALDSDGLARDLDRLRSGDAVDLPNYDFSSHRRMPETRWDRCAPHPVILVEGILVLAVDGLRERFDLSIYVDAPDDIRLLRRLRRDVAERGRTMGGVLDQYQATVRPMHQSYVAPSRSHADLVVDGTLQVDEQLERLFPHLSTLDGGPLR